MISLLLNIVFGSIFILILKWVQLSGRFDVVNVGAINYLVALCLVVPLQRALREIPQSSHDVGLWWAAVGCGSALGICYFTAFFFVIRAIRVVGASRTAVVGALSMLLPIAAGFLLWNEQPGIWQAAGVGLAIVALVLIAQRGQVIAPNARWFSPLILLGFFLLAGLGRLAQEAFKHTSHPDYRPMFLLVAFSVASLPSLGLLLSRRRLPTRMETIAGAALGASNILQTHFLLRALERLEGFVVFPASSAGGLLLTTLVATAFLGERLQPRAAWGIALATVALVLLNWTNGA